MRINRLVLHRTKGLSGPLFQPVGGQPAGGGSSVHGQGNAFGVGGPLAGDGSLFSWSAYSLALPTGATFTRAGTAYVQDHEGKYWLAAANWPRFGGARIADPLANGELVYYDTDALGDPIDPDTIYLLDEPAATNYTPYSFALDTGATWAVARTAVASAGAVVASVGKAIKLNETAIPDTHELRNTYNAPSATSSVIRVLLKAGERTIGGISTNTGTFRNSNIDLTSGATNVGQMTAVRSISAGDGWWWFYAEFTASTTAGHNRCNITICTGTVGSPTIYYLGEVGKGIYCAVAEQYFGCTIDDVVQLSPIATGAAAVTRAADVLNFSGADGFDSDNETRLEYLDTADVDADDWDGAVDADPDTYGKLQAITLYKPGERP